VKSDIGYFRAMLCSIRFIWSKKGDRTKIMNVLFLSLLILLLVIFVRYSFKANLAYTITQQSISDVSHDSFAEKTPLVLLEAVVDPAALARTVFRNNHISMRSFRSPANVKHRASLASHTLVCCTESVSIYIVNPEFPSLPRSLDAFMAIKSRNAPTYVEVRLLANKVLILPAFWSFYPSCDVTCIAVYDLCSGPRMVGRW
jgi:hypothetical protein